MALILLFLPQNHKNHSAAGGSAPRTLLRYTWVASVCSAWGLNKTIFLQKKTTFGSSPHPLSKILVALLVQARRQDSVTGGAEINFGGTSSLVCVNSRGARGHQKFIPVWIKWTRWESKIQRDFPAGNRNCKRFSARNRKFKQFFRPKTGDLQKKKVFIPKTSRNPLSVKKKHQFGPRFALQYSPNPVNFFGAQSSLGGAQFSFGGQKQSFGGHVPGMPPRGAGSVLVEFTVADRFFRQLSGLDTKRSKKRYRSYTSRFSNMSTKLLK